MSPYGFFRWLPAAAFAVTIAGCVSGNRQSALPTSDGLPASLPRTAQHVYVLEFDAAKAVLEYPITNGIPASTPDRSITGLTGPNAIAFDSSGKLYILDGRTVKEFAVGASGNAKPLRTIDVPVPYNIGSLAVDSTGYLYVGQTGQVFVYAPGASGHAKPVAKIKPIGYPAGLEIGSGDRLFALGNTQKMHPTLTFEMHVTVFSPPPAPKQTRTFCSGWLPNHGIDYGIALDDGSAFTTHPYFINSSPHGEIDVYASGDGTCPAKPAAVITTTGPSLLEPVYLALNGSYLYVYDLDYGNGGVVFTLRTSGDLQTPLDVLYVRNKQPHNVQGIGVGP